MTYCANEHHDRSDIIYLYLIAINCYIFNFNWAYRTYCCRPRETLRSIKNKMNEWSVSFVWSYFSDIHSSFFFKGYDIICNKSKALESIFHFTCWKMSSKLWLQLSLIRKREVEVLHYCMELYNVQSSTVRTLWRNAPNLNDWHVSLLLNGESPVDDNTND